MGFFRNALFVAGGTTVGQAILVAAMPVLTHLYSPGDFGEWTVLFSVAALFQGVASGRYELAIVLPERDEDAANVLALALLATVGTSALLLGLVTVAGGAVAHGLGIEDLARWLWTLPVMALLTGLYQAGMYWATRTRDFRSLGATRVALAVAMVATQVAGGQFFGGGPAWLIAGTLAGQAVGTFGLLGRALAGSRRPPYRALRWAAVRRSAAQYRRFPSYNLPYIFLGILRDRMLVFLMSALASTHAVGLYSVASKLSYLPVSLVGMSVSVVFFQHAAAERDRRALGAFVTGLLERFALLGAPAIVLFVFDVPALFGLALGSPWEPAAPYAQLLALPAFFALLNTALDRMLDVLGRQLLALSLEAVATVVSLAAFAVTLLVLDDPLPAVGAYAAVVVAYYAVWLVVVFRVSKFPAAELGRVGLTFASVLAGAAAIHWLALAWLGRAGGLALIAVLAAGYYARRLWLYRGSFAG